jgi:branched-chain amino acid transport system ATP-binding protein
VLVQHLFDTIGEMRERLGMAVLLVEQNVNEALRLASRAYVMQEGRLVFEAACSERDAIIHHLWGLARTLASPAQDM